MTRDDSTRGPMSTSDLNSCRDESTPPRIANVSFGSRTLLTSWCTASDDAAEPAVHSFEASCLEEALCRLGPGLERVEGKERDIDCETCECSRQQRGGIGWCRTGLSGR